MALLDVLRPVVYVKLEPDLLTVREVGSGRTISEPPVTAGIANPFKHPRVNPEGGWTQIEIRALHELAMGAGASRVVVWHGREISDEELREQRFDAGGEVLR